jgi:hypothetical protein
MLPIDKLKFFSSALTVIDKRTHEGLKATIKEMGFLVPIVVIADKDGKYLVVDGRQRVEIAKEFGWTEVPAHVIDAPIEMAELIAYSLSRWRGKLDVNVLGKVVSEKDARGVKRRDMLRYSAMSSETLKYLLMRKAKEVKVAEEKVKQKRPLKNVVKASEVKIPLIFNLSKEEYDKVVEVLKKYGKDERTAFMKLIEAKTDNE